MRRLLYKQGTITNPALSDHLETWLESFLIDRKVQNLSPGTLAFYRKKLRLFAAFCEGQVIGQIEQITPDVIRRWLLHLEDTGHNPGGIHACYRALRAFLRWYWEETDQEGNPPTAKVKAPRVALDPLLPVNLEDVTAMLKTCAADLLGARDKAALMALLDTGARAAEFVALDLDDVDFTSGAVLVREGKGRKPRTVFLGQTSRRALRAYVKLRQDDNPALWLADKGTRLTYWGLREMVERRAHRAGIKPPSLHSFRRAFCLEMLRAGVDLVSLQTIMGHADLQTLRRYLAQVSEDLRAAHVKGSPVNGKLKGG
jgi:site-specific recombinase XerD